MDSDNNAMDTGSTRCRFVRSRDLCKQNSWPSVMKVLWPCHALRGSGCPETGTLLVREHIVHRSANKCFAGAIYRQGNSISQFVFLFTSCLFILSRSLAERLPPHPPRTLNPPQINTPIASLLHIAFPSQDLPVPFGTRPPLRGLLAADLVGFQATS